MAPFIKLLRACSSAVDKVLSHVFGRLGKLVAVRPWTTIAISIFLVGALAYCGFSRFATETNPYKLYIPESARATRDDESRVLARFGWIPIQAKLLVYSKKGADANLLASPKESLLEMMDIWDAIVGETKDRPFSAFKAICSKPRSGLPCRTSSILALWDYNRTKLENDPDILGTLNSGPVTDQYGKQNPISVNLGGIKRTSEGRMVEATVFYNYFTFGSRLDHAETARFLAWLGPAHINDTYWELKETAKQSGFHPRPFALDNKIAKSMQNWEKKRSTKLQARMTHLERVTVESELAIAKDMCWAILAVLLVFLLSCGVLWRNSQAHCKSHLAIVSLIAIAMALAAGFGLALLIGVEFNLVAAAVPFLIMGMGIDDTFIIMGYFRKTDPDVSPADRVANTMSKAGASIFITSITDLAAFLIGLTSSIPALRAFSVYASFGVLFDFLFQITFFVAFVAFEARREYRNADILPAPTVEGKEYVNQCSDTDTTGDHKASNASQTPLHKLSKVGSKRIIGGGTFNASTQSIGSKFFGHWMPSALFTWQGMVVTFMIEALLLAGGIYGSTRATTDFRYREWFTPRNSWLRDGFQLEHKYFSGNQARLSLYTTGGSHFYNQREMLQCISQFEKSPYVSSVPRLTSWFKDYTEWISHSRQDLLAYDDWAPNSTVFVELVSGFLHSPEGSMYFDDIKFNKNRTHIISTKLISAFSINVDGAPDGISMMTDLKERATISIPHLSPAILSDLFAIYEGLRVLKEDTIKNLIIVGAVVFFMVVVMLANVKAAALVSLMLILIDIILIGSMWFVGLSFNMVTSMCVVLAVGITVGYSVHIAHNFLTQTGTNKERATAALRDIGGEVLCGAVTSWLAIMGLVFTQTYTMQVFFKMFSLLIGLGAWHGIVVLPVLLTLLGPASYTTDE